MVVGEFLAAIFFFYLDDIPAMAPHKLVPQASGNGKTQSAPSKRTDTDQLEKMSTYYKAILTSIGENPEREGLRDTPLRAAKAFNFFTKGKKKRN